MPDRFKFSVTIPADEWETAKRRVRFLEAAIVQAMRQRGGLREWFAASTLADLRLPGLPTTRHGVMTRAKREGWTRRIGMGPGGEQIEYHFSTLPRPAFDEVIRRVYALPEGMTDVTEAVPPPAPAKPAPIAATPQWLLPLMRVVRADANADPETVLRELPRLMPPGSALPTLQEVATALQRQRRR